MINKIIALIVLIVVLFGVFYFENVLVSKDDELGDNQQIEDFEDIVRTVEVKHQYKDGTHIFVGEIELPTPCHAYNASIENDASKNIWNIIVKTIEPEEGAVCAQSISEKSWKVTHEGLEDLKFGIFINDKEYSLNIFEIPEHVDIDQFEIYLKG